MTLVQVLKLNFFRSLQNFKLQALSKVVVNIF